MQAEPLNQGSDGLREVKRGVRLIRLRVRNQVFRGQRSFGHVVALLFAAVAIMSIHAYAVPLLGVLFVLWGPARYLVHRALHRRDAEEPIF